MKKIILVVLVLAIVFCGCTAPEAETHIVTESPHIAASSDRPPEISVYINDAKIDHVVGLNMWNGAIYDRLDNFSYWLSMYKPMFVPSDMDTKDVKIVIHGDIPDNASLACYDLTNDTRGSRIKTFTPEFINGEINFSLNDYPQGKLLGFELTCSWGFNECAYGFLVGTEQYRDKL